MKKLSGFISGAICGALLYAAIEHLNDSPRFKGSMESRNVQSLYKLLYAHAIDHEGKFPTGDKSSNEALRFLFQKNYMAGASEKMFGLTGSPWHKNLKSKGPDGDIGSPPEFAKALEAGENVWAYHSGLTVDSHSSEALLVNAAYEAGDSNPNEKILITSVSGSTQIVSGSGARELAMKKKDGTKWLQPLK